MKTIKTCLVLLTIAILGKTAIDLRSAQYEYAVVAYEDMSMAAKLKEDGAEGWSVATCRRALAGEGGARKGVYECIMQRRVWR